MGRVREKRRVEERRSEKRKNQKKEDADARKGRKVAKHCVFPMICGSGGSKSRLAKAAGAEPSGQMRDEKLHGPLLEVAMSKKCRPLWREAHFEVKTYKTHHARTTFRSCDVEKVHAVVARRTFRSQKCKKLTGTEHFWTFRCAFAWQGQGIVHLLKSEQNREGFVAFPQTMASVGHLKRICKDAFRVAGAVQKICSSEMLGGQRADFLRGVAFWSIRCAGLLR